jgi:hypothetical protein
LGRASRNICPLVPVLDWRSSDACEGGRLLWIREAQIFFMFDHSSVEKRCRNLDLHGVFVMSSEKIMRLLGLFLVFFFARFYARCTSGSP